jgi:translation initiation factor IF-3
MNVNLIDENGKFISNISFEEARRLAKTQAKDLILLNGKTNTYKIADAGKLKYEQKQKDRQNRAQKRLHKIKEIKMRPVIDKHDLEVKTNYIRDFLSRGLKTKLIMTLRGRQMAHKDLALEKFNEIPNLLVAEGIATLESPPKFDGRTIIAMLIPVVPQKP